MSTFDTLMAANASSNASAARRAAQEAQETAEEALEGVSVFVPLKANDFDVEERFWSPDLYTIKKETYTVAVKNTDIAYIKEATDAAGVKFAKVVLEERCDYEEGWLGIKDTVENVAKFINQFSVGVKRPTT